MIRRLGWIPLLLSGLLLWTVQPLLASSDDGSQEGKSFLSLPPNAPDLDAAGKIEIEHHVNSNHEKLAIEAKHLDAGQIFEVFMEDALGSGNLVNIGKMTSESNDHSGSDDGAGSDGDSDDNGSGSDGDSDDGSGDDSGDDDHSSSGSSTEYKLVFNTKKGDSLPFGVTLVSELSGRAVEIRSGGVVYLTGTVPDLGSGGSSGGSSWTKVESYLVRPIPSPDPDAKGSVEIGKKNDGSNQKFQVEAEHLDVTTVAYSVWLENAVGSGVLENVGQMFVKGFHEVKLEIETQFGATLPFGVTDVADLSGRLIEVRGDDGQTYLTGVVPSFSTQSASGKSDLTGVGKGRVRAKAAKKKKVVHQVFEVKVKKQGKKQDLEIWMRHPVTGTFEMVATLHTSKSGKASYKVKTKKGQPLPFGVPSIQELSGLEVQIRVAGTGEVRLQGQVPNL